MSRWNGTTTEHVKAAIAANTCPLCGGRLARVTWRVPPSLTPTAGRQCRSCGAEVGVEPEPPCQLKLVD